MQCSGAFSDCSCFPVQETFVFYLLWRPRLSPPALLLLPSVITFQTVLHCRIAVALWEGLFAFRWLPYSLLAHPWAISTLSCGGIYFPSLSKDIWFHNKICMRFIFVKRTCSMNSVGPLIMRKLLPSSVVWEMFLSQQDACSNFIQPKLSFFCVFTDFSPALCEVIPILCQSCQTFLPASSHRPNVAVDSGAGTNTAGLGRLGPSEMCCECVTWAAWVPLEGPSVHRVVALGSCSLLCGTTARVCGYLITSYSYANW